MANEYEFIKDSIDNIKSVFSAIDNIKNAEKYLANSGYRYSIKVHELLTDSKIFLDHELRTISKHSNVVLVYADHVPVAVNEEETIANFKKDEALLTMNRLSNKLSKE